MYFLLLYVPLEHLVDVCYHFRCILCHHSNLKYILETHIGSDHFQRSLYTLKHLLFVLQNGIVNGRLIKKREPCPAADVTMLEGVGITVGSCFQNNDPGREDTLHLCPKPAQRRPATLMLQTRSLLFLLQYSPQNLIIAWAIYIYIYIWMCM